MADPINVATKTEKAATGQAYCARSIPARRRPSESVPVGLDHEEGAEADHQGGRGGVGQHRPQPFAHDPLVACFGPLRATPTTSRPTATTTTAIRRRVMLPSVGMQRVSAASSYDVATACGDVERGGPPGTRTLNRRVKSPLLCQLS
jgi:hypothetical protein